MYGNLKDCLSDMLNCDDAGSTALCACVINYHTRDSVVISQLLCVVRSRDDAYGDAEDVPWPGGPVAGAERVLHRMVHAERPTGSQRDCSYWERRWYARVCTLDSYIYKIGSHIII